MPSKESMKLKITLEKEDDKWVITEKMTGISTYAKTKIEAVKRFCEALDLWYEAKHE